MAGLVTPPVEVVGEVPSIAAPAASPHNHFQEGCDSVEHFLVALCQAQKGYADEGTNVALHVMMDFIKAHLEKNAEKIHGEHEELTPEMLSQHLCGAYLAVEMLGLLSQRPFTSGVSRALASTGGFSFL